MEKMYSQTISNKYLKKFVKIWVCGHDKSIVYYRDTLQGNIY